jgi:hypothetical protein
MHVTARLASLLCTPVTKATSVLALTYRSASVRYAFATLNIRANPCPSPVTG